MVTIIIDKANVIVFVTFSTEPASAIEATSGEGFAFSCFPVTAITIWTHKQFIVFVLTIVKPMEIIASFYVTIFTYCTYIIKP